MTKSKINKVKEMIMSGKYTDEEINKMIIEVENEYRQHIQKSIDDINSFPIISCNGTNLKFKHVNKSYNINSAITFNQMLFKGKKLITLIGEYHITRWTCPKPNITIAQYCLMVTLSNPNSRVMIEQTPDKPKIFDRAGSLLETIPKHLKMYNKEHLLKNWDLRKLFLTMEDLVNLYQDDDNSITSFYSRVRILKSYIDPFFNNLDCFLIDKKHYDTDVYVFLLKYLKRLITRFSKFRDGIKSGNMSIDNIKPEIRFSWSILPDYFVLCELLKNNSVNHYIILGGNFHTDNMFDTLKTANFMLTLLDSRMTEGKDSCVNAQNSYMF